MPLQHSTPRLDRRSFVNGVAAATIAGRWLVSSPAFGQRAADGGLIYHTRIPANAEPPLGELIENWITPNDRFYIRSHAPVPEIAVGTYRLVVEGLVERPLSLSLEQINQLADADVVATLTCAGNRRNEYSQTKQVEGVPWEAGAIGNARWGGVKLSTILKKAGVKERARHVWFDGLDEIKKGDSTIAFGGSIPIQKAMLDTDDTPGALVVTKMNGQPLPPDHGFPVRNVVPGYIGARSVKWLGRIVVSYNPSPNHYLQDAYKLIPNGDKLLLAEAPPIYPYRTNSVICTPTAGATLKAGKITVAGYALPAGQAGTALARVEVSTDGGRSWTPAKLEDSAKPYCWQLWRAEVDVEPATKQLVVRALDSTGQMQPRAVEWNMKGYLYTAWHRVPITVEG